MTTTILEEGKDSLKFEWVIPNSKRIFEKDYECASEIILHSQTQTKWALILEPLVEQIKSEENEESEEGYDNKESENGKDKDNQTKVKSEMSLMLVNQKNSIEKIKVTRGIGCEELNECFTEEISVYYEPFDLKFFDDEHQFKTYELQQCNNLTFVAYIHFDSIQTNGLSLWICACVCVFFFVYVSGVFANRETFRKIANYIFFVLRICEFIECLPKNGTMQKTVKANCNFFLILQKQKIHSKQIPT